MSVAVGCRAGLGLMRPLDVVLLLVIPLSSRQVRCLVTHQVVYVLRIQARVVRDRLLIGALVSARRAMEETGETDWM
jgi:hypothetical protein